MAPQANEDKSFNRNTGLLIIEVRHSNPNGDPDAESDPRTIDADGRGLISPVSLKRKLRDLVADQEGPAWKEAERVLKLMAGGNSRKYGILESRGRDRDAISGMRADEFTDAFWDARLFGNTFLENLEEKEETTEEAAASGSRKGRVAKKMKGREAREHFISTGVVQFGPGVSVAPVEIERLTMTNKAGVEEGKDRGMAPLGWRVVRHGIYAMPFFVNPMMATKTCCTTLDVDLMKFMIPLAYRCTASAIRPEVELRHAWCAEHKSALGSCPDYLILDALTPTKVKADEPSTSIDEYRIPAEKDLPAEVRARLADFKDLCMEQWD